MRPSVASHSPRFCYHPLTFPPRLQADDPPPFPHLRPPGPGRHVPLPIDSRSMPNCGKAPTAWAAGFLPPPVAVHAEADKGEGLRALAPLRKGQIIFTERPMARAALRDSPPHCDHCCRSMVTWALLIAGEHAAALRQLPQADALWPQFPGARRCECHATFCSDHCLHEAREQYHAVLCRRAPQQVFSPPPLHGAAGEWSEAHVAGEDDHEAHVGGEEEQDAHVGGGGDEDEAAGRRGRELTELEEMSPQTAQFPTLTLRLVATIVSRARRTARERFAAGKGVSGTALAAGKGISVTALDAGKGISVTALAAGKRVSGTALDAGKGASGIACEESVPGVFAEEADLEEAFAAILGGMARLHPDVTPEYPIPLLHSWVTSSCTLGARELAWVTEGVVLEVLGIISANAIRAKPASPFSNDPFRFVGIISANAIRAKPASPFSDYVRNLSRALGAEHRGDGMREVARCAAAVAGNPDLPASKMDAVMWEAWNSPAGRLLSARVTGHADAEANCPRMDAVMWEACGVEAACIYALQCKCNHSCDASAEAVTYTLPDCSLDLIASRDIRLGAEVTISYVDPSKRVRDRRATLRITHGFTCECARCTAGERFCATTRRWTREPTPKAPLDVSSDAPLGGASDVSGGAGDDENGAEEEQPDVEFLDALFDALDVPV